MKEPLVDVAIIGGGLAGLVSALILAKNGCSVTVIEKGEYPFHKVCGEYISNEVLPLLTSLGANPMLLSPQKITRFQLSSPSGKSTETELPLGGFSVSRYALDHFLYCRAEELGVRFWLKEKAEKVSFEKDGFTIETLSKKTLKSRIVIGSYGKRSHLDRKWNRPFFSKRSPYMAVKYHAEGQYPSDLVGLYNFGLGYCGVSQVETGHLNICYLTSRDALKRYKSIPELEKHVLHRNPMLREILLSSPSIFPQPLVINEISFSQKQSVVNHVLMCGDASGLITPVCGNGMAMAIHGAQIAADKIQSFLDGEFSRDEMEKEYKASWRKTFRSRLWAGRNIQQLFEVPFLAELSVWGLQSIPGLDSLIIRQTHGDPLPAYEPI